MDPSSQPTTTAAPAVYQLPAHHIPKAAHSTDTAAYATAPQPLYVHNPYADQDNADPPQKQQRRFAAGGDYHPWHTGRTGLVSAEVIQGDEASIPQGTYF